jgi:hypothetical protein
MMEVIHSSKTSVLTRVTWRHIPEDGIFIVTAVKTSNLTLNYMFGDFADLGLERKRLRRVLLSVFLRVNPKEAHWMQIVGNP